VYRSTLIIVFVAFGAVVLNCRSTLAPAPAEVVFQVRACFGSLQSPNGEVFRILLRDPSLIRQARALVGAGQQRIVTGALAQGDGGFNAPWNWHLDPDTIGFVEAAVEVCDGCPSFIESNGGHWDSGRYCPWRSEVIAEGK